MKISVLIKSLIVFLLFTFLLPSITPSAFAQAKTAPTSNYSAASTNPDVQDNLHNRTQTVMIETMSSLICQLTGIDPINSKQSCLGVDQNTGKIGFLPSTQKGGAIGLMGNMIIALYTPPVRTSDYFRNLASNFGIFKKTYAQETGTGFDSLSPLLGLWTAFRNIAYLVFVIVFIIVGLAIMLRIKIDPRTVMTIQNQIPKIIIGILMITFSYAIAGFLIDMMYVSINLAGNIVASADTELQTTGIVAQLTSDTNPFAAVGHVGRNGGSGIALGLADIVWNPASAVGSFIGPFFDNPPGRIVVGIAGYFVGKTVSDNSKGIFEGVGGAIGALVGLAAGGVGAIPGAAIGAEIGDVINSLIPVAGATAGALFPSDIMGTVASLIAFLVIAVALLVALFRLWFSLIIAYIEILLGVVLAPFWIIGGIIPGSSINLSGWLKNMCANLLAFPATIVMFLLGKVFIDSFGTTQVEGEFVPPLIGARLSTNAIGSLIGLGIILITPNIIGLLKQAFKTPRTGLGVRAAIMAGSPTTMFNKAGQIGLSISGINTGIGMLPIVGKSKKTKGGAPSA